MSRAMDKAAIRSGLQSFLGENPDYIAETSRLFDGLSTHIRLDFEEIVYFSEYLTGKLVEKPGLFLDIFKGLLDDERQGDQEPADLRVRVYNLPEALEVPASQIRTSDLTQLIRVRGRLTKCQQVRSKVQTGAWKCKRCGVVIYVDVDGTDLKPPVQCKGKKDNGCNKTATSFKFVEEDSTFEDSQVLYVEEIFDSEKKGQPQTIMCVVTGDAVGVFTTNEIILNGVARNYRPKDNTAINDFYLDVISVETTEAEDDLHLTKEDKAKFEELIHGLDDPIETFIQSTAPHIAGNTQEKEAIVLQLFGGVRKTINGGATVVRGDSHILLVGDYSSGKSHLLKCSAALAPRGMFGSAENVTVVGLTCAVVKDPIDGQFTVEMGLLPLCDGGHCVIDELDKMPGGEKKLLLLHTPLEDQISPYAKAGLVGSFHTRCSVLAGANPKKSRFDPFSDPIEQISLPASLMSRFDLVFPMKDVPEKIRDNAIANAVLSVHFEQGAIDPPIKPRDLRKIIAYAREAYNPQLTEAAVSRLKEYYLTLRGLNSDGGAVAAVPRNLNGYVRLAEASARARFSKEVTIEDVDRAIKISTNALNRLMGSRWDIDAIITGKTANTRDRQEAFIYYMRMAKNRTIEEITEFYKDEGYDTAFIVKDIDNFRRKGEIYDLRGLWHLAGGR